MDQIKTIFYFVNKDADYRTQWEAGEISNKTIVFVEDTREIYFNGRGYGKTSTAGLITDDQFDTWKSAIQSRITALIDQMNQETELINGSVQNQLDEFSTSFNTFQNQIEDSIATEIQNAISDLESADSAIRADLVRTDNSISAVTSQVSGLETRVNGFSEGSNIKYTSALQSVLDTGIANNSAFTSLSSRWAVADANQNLLKWMASGFASQVNENTNFATIFSTYKDTVDGHTNSISAIETKADENEAKLNAIANWSNGELVSYKAGFLTQADIEGSMASLISSNESNDVKSAITTYVNGNNSGIILSADHISMNGDVIANRLLAAHAIIGGFTINNGSLTGTTSESSFIDRIVNLTPTGLEFYRNDNNGTSRTTDDAILLKLTINPADGIVILDSGISTQFNIDGSGNIARGRFAWDENGYITITQYPADVEPALNIITQKPSGNANPYTSISGEEIITTGSVSVGERITAQSIVKTGATSNDILLGDGSTLDKNTVVITGSSVDIDALADAVTDLSTDISLCLPLSGGTLTGNLLITNNQDVVTISPSSIQIINDASGIINIGVNGNADLTVDLNVYANGFKVPNGTSSQFLKADGSVDSTLYLPISGGTVNGNVSANNISSYYSNGAESITLNGRTVEFYDSDSNVLLTMRLDDGVQISGDNPTVTAGGFIKENGTSSEILMADGSTMTLAELKAALNNI